MTSNYTVASADALRGFEHVGIDDIEEEELSDGPPQMHMNKGKLPARGLSTKGVHFTPSTAGTESETDSSPGTEVFTHSRHASWSTSSPVSAIPESLPDFQAPYETELLRPVKYGEPRPFDDEPHIGSQRDEALSTLSNGRPRSTPNGRDDLTVDTTSHARSTSETSSSSRRGKKNPNDLYFTPTDVTRSKIFFSSPKGSPNLPLHGDSVTSTTSTPAPRPAITIPTEPAARSSSRKREKETLKITPAQLDQLTISLAKNRTLQKHVRKYWWDDEDIPDDESVTTMDTPTLTRASALYSRQNDNFVHQPPSSISEEAQAFATRPLPEIPSSTVEGVALTDPKIHGSPIRFMSSGGYKFGSKGLGVGSCSFLNIPFGTEGECSLHIRESPMMRVVLQCVNQVVDRKTGSRTYLLAAEIDVTRHIRSAALEQFAKLIAQPISIIASPTANIPLNSPEVDWIALADTLQANSHTADLIESALPNLSPPPTLLKILDEIKDQHSDFLILKPTAYHPNGIPAKVSLPWCSQRLYKDWYLKTEAHGRSEAAERFKADLVEAVVKRAGDEEFLCEVGWGESSVLVVRCVPVFEGVGTGERAQGWVCFVRGTVEVAGEER